MGNLICFSNKVCQNLHCFQLTCVEQPLHSERCRWLNVAHITETACFNSGINLQSAVHAITSLSSLSTLVQYANTRPLQCVIEMRSFGISLRSKRSSTGPYLHGFHQRRGVWALLASALCLAVPHNQLSAAPSEPSLENLKAKCNQ